jgi:hypothetical protein
VWLISGVWLVRTLRSTAGLHSGHAVLLRVRTSPESSLTTVAILQYIWFGWPDVLRRPRNCQQQTVAVDVAACLSALIDAIWERSHWIECTFAQSSHLLHFHRTTVATEYFCTLIVCQILLLYVTELYPASGNIHYPLPTIGTTSQLENHQPFGSPVTVALRYANRPSR